MPSREKGMEDARSQVNLYKAKKKTWNKSENDMVSRMFHLCKKKILNFVLVLILLFE